LGFPLLALGVFAALTFQAASTDQLEFFLKPNAWMNHISLYVEAKMLMIVINATPSIMLVVALLACNDQKNAVRGFMFGVLTTAIIGLARTSPYIYLLLKTEENSNLYFGQPELQGFSIVSFGSLCFCGAVAAMTLPRAWMLGAVFHFMAFWTNRKIEFILITLLAILIWLWKFNSQTLWTKWRIVPFLAFTLVGIVTLHNDANVTSWKFFSQSFVNRSALVESAVKGAEYKPDVYELRVETPNPCAIPGRCKKPSRQVNTFLFGKGLGWYASLGGAYKYPHNSIVESYAETGIISTTLLLLVFLIPIASVFLTTIGGASLSEIGISLMFAGLVVLSQKSGDLSDVARFLPPILTLPHLLNWKKRIDPQGLGYIPSIALWTNHLGRRAQK
jgi:hypothetical protein